MQKSDKRFNWRGDMGDVSGRGLPAVHDEGVGSAVGSVSAMSLAMGWRSGQVSMDECVFEVLSLGRWGWR